METLLSAIGSNHERSCNIIQPGDTRRRSAVLEREPTAVELLTVREVDRLDTHAID